MNHVVEQSRHLLRNFLPSGLLQTQLHKKVFMQFAEKIGLVYFGYVDQRADDHRLVRGATVSARHRDNHYCIGSFDSYDITLVERRDTLSHPGKRSKHHTWIILVVDLHTPVDLPHIFAGLHTHSETFYAQLFTKYSTLTKVPLGTYAAHDPQFVTRYAVYSEPAHALLAEQLLAPELTRAIADHFGSLTFEISEGSVYIYAEHQRPTASLLERMLKNGLWLARTLDVAVDKRPPA